MRQAAAFVCFALAAMAVGVAQQPANTKASPFPAPATQNRSTLNSAQNLSQPAGQNTVPNTSGQTAGNPVLEQQANGSSGGDVPANTELRATLDTPLSSKTSKAGDRFTATISQAVQGRLGVVVPTGARVEGEVSEPDQEKDLPGLHGKGKLNLRLRDIVLPNGQTVPLMASLVSVNRTNGQATQRADNEGQIESGTAAKNAAGNLGAGTGTDTAGSVVFGGPLKGLAIGALAGGGYVLSTIGKDINLPAQTGMIIRLEQPLVVQ